MEPSQPHQERSRNIICTARGHDPTPRPPYPARRRYQHRGPKRGDGIGYSGDKHQKGEKVIARTDNHGDVLSPLPDGLKALKKVAQAVNLDLRGSEVNLDAGFDSTYNRQCMFNAGMIPNITEHPRNRKRTKRGRKRFFNEAIHALRARVDRTFAWEDKFQRLLLRFEYIQRRPYGMKLLAYTLINVREFCWGGNSELVRCVMSAAYLHHLAARTMHHLPGP